MLLLIFFHFADKPTVILYFIEGSFMAEKNYIGVNIADKYSITGKIGSGGMGQVYSAISMKIHQEL